MHCINVYNDGSGRRLAIRRQDSSQFLAGHQKVNNQLLPYWRCHEVRGRLITRWIPWWWRWKSFCPMGHRLYIEFCSNISEVNSEVSKRPSMKPITSSTSGSRLLICRAKLAIWSTSGNFTLAHGCIFNFCTTNDNIAVIVWLQTEGVTRAADWREKSFSPVHSPFWPLRTGTGLRTDHVASYYIRTYKYVFT